MSYESLLLWLDVIGRSSCRCGAQYVQSCGADCSRWLSSHAFTPKVKCRKHIQDYEWWHISLPCSPMCLILSMCLWRLNFCVSLKDLSFVGLLGVGGFSKVELWQHMVPGLNSWRFSESLWLCEASNWGTAWQSNDFFTTYCNHL
jgi:hypothetical protein